MTLHDPRLRPIERFLGPAEAAGGPFALLGLSPAACTDDLVLSALDRQVEKINRHPECDTPEADEVRLAVHAAAAQLLDPVVRRHLIARYSGAAVRPAAVAAPAPLRRESPADWQRLLEADAILTLGLFGGWNQRALRRLVSLAHRRGLTNHQVAETLKGLAGKRRRPRPERPVVTRRPTSRLQASPSSSTPAVALPNGVSTAGTPNAPSSINATGHDPSLNPPQVPDPSTKILRNAAILGLLAMGGLAAAIIGIILATRSPAPPPAPSPSPVVSAPPPAVVPDTTPTAPEPARPKRQALPVPDAKDIAFIPRAIAACTEALAIEPAAAVSQLEPVIARLAAHWPALPRDNRIAAHDALVEFLYRCGPAPGIAERAIGAIGRHAGAFEAGPAADKVEVTSSIWSVGMLARLGRERDLSGTTKNAIESALVAAMGPARASMDPSFESGATVAAQAWPARLTPTEPSQEASLSAWSAWASCAAALSGLSVASDHAMGQRTILAGLETLLVQGPEPNANRSVASVISELVGRITWRAEDESRQWLLRWFADRRISTADLNVVTSTLATRSAAEGIDLTMVLSTSASDNTRAELRERYATIWSIRDALARDEQIVQWAELTREAINSSYTSSSETDDFAAGVALLRLNEAAWWQWKGDAAEVTRILNDPRGPVDQAMSLSVRERQDAAAPDLSDGAWAERYFGAKNNVRAKRELIDQLANATTIGPTDAEVLMGEAFTGSPQDIRAAAQEAVKKHAESASMLNALLERLPRVPRTAAAAELVSVVAGKPLPGFRDPEWPMAARRAVVERLLESIASESPRVRIDRLSIVLSACYRGMAAPAPIPPDQRAARVQPAAHASAAEVYRRWRAMADKLAPSTPPPISLDQIERRRVSRQSQARGMVQAFAAEQASIVEIMSYTITCEQPASADQVRLILSNMAADRRRAAHVLEQIKIAERAIGQLWLVRFKQEPAT
ncbi:MAG: hypothetical protein KF678_10835 [Phycisphaeraceae bacterium]|nr:hypothetical protein [Phycisphaeraceae bacterium]